MLIREICYLRVLILKSQNHKVKELKLEKKSIKSQIILKILFLPMLNNKLLIFQKRNWKLKKKKKKKLSKSAGKSKF